MSEAQIFVNNCIWGTNWLQTGKRKCSAGTTCTTATKFTNIYIVSAWKRSNFRPTVLECVHSTMWDHNTDMHKSISLTAFQHRLKQIFPHYLLEKLSDV